MLYPRNFFWLCKSFFFILMAAIFLVGCRYVDDDMRAPLRSGDLKDRLDYAIATDDINSAIGVINNQKQPAVREDVVRLLKVYWNKQDPEFKSTKNQVRFKLEIADYIIQQLIANEGDARVNEYIIFSRNVVGSGDVDNAARALRILAFVGDKEDLAIFVKNLNSKEKIIADSAAIGIGMSCDISMQDAAKLRNTIESDSQRKYFDETWNGLAMWRSSCKKSPKE